MLCFHQYLLFTSSSESVDDFNLKWGLKLSVVGGLSLKTQTKVHWRNFKNVCCSLTQKYELLPNVSENFSMAILIIIIYMYLRQTE